LTISAEITAGVSCGSIPLPRSYAGGASTCRNTIVWVWKRPKFITD